MEKCVSLMLRPERKTTKWCTYSDYISVKESPQYAQGHNMKMSVLVTGL